ncbi:glycosyltransferase family 9 protein [Candidatus Viridilinea mediisalina]|uniref:Glycosyl transferase n=1 Tax=Candidatus Viridilinea mediisalina TaxID=2024553 RepID=A0A2A6RI92_9CHLR|nr:glycosyltransferase family 9 protein [Candidatus Viridilinea mediisalina]PDW02663.1 glycosyl transferase [Candidatus Viridilinea mediisalina]
MPPSSRQRILLIKPDHLGDLLLATPALAALRQGLPQAQLTGLVGPWAYQMWQRNPQLDALTTLPFPGFTRNAAPRRSLRPYLLLLHYGLLLRRQRYTAALLLRDDHWWGALLAWVAGIPQRIGHAHPAVQALLTTALPYDPREHVTRQALAVVGALVGQPLAHTPTGSPPLHFQPTPAEHAWASQWVAQQLQSDLRLVVIHAGTGGPCKHWLPAHWATVADQIASQPATRLLLTGGPGEAALVAEIAQRMRQPALQLAGQTSVGQLAALLGRAALVLGVDSGPLHLAVSQGVPTRHLYGPSDHLRFGPWGDPQRHQVIRADLACSPCGVFAACPRATLGPECMAAISPERVVSSLV